MTSISSRRRGSVVAPSLKTLLSTLMNEAVGYLSSVERMTLWTVSLNRTRVFESAAVRLNGTEPV